MSGIEITIDNIIANITQANNNARDAIENNDTFHKTLKSSLGLINQQIAAIDTKIRDLIDRLKQTESQVVENNKTIAQTNSEKESLQKNIDATQNELSSINTDLQNNEAERQNLQSQLETSKIANEEEIARLQAQLEKDKADLKGANEEEKKVLLKEIEDTQKNMMALEKNNADEIAQIKSHLEELNNEKKKLTDELDSSRQAIQKLTEDSHSLEMNINELRQQNNDLNAKLESAKLQMTRAVEYLNSLSDSSNHNEINGIIEQINRQLTEINSLLNIKEGNDDAEFFDAQNMRGPMVDKNSSIMFNGTQNTLENIIKFLKVKNNQLKNNNPDNKYKQALNFINNDATSAEAIQSYLDRDNYKGGRKTRKIKRRKTRKTRKTKKVRKQKGGYHYSERAKRRSITTTARRASKRSSRRTSSI